MVGVGERSRQTRRQTGQGEGKEGRRGGVLTSRRDSLFSTDEHRPSCCAASYRGSPKHLDTSAKQRREGGRGSWQSKAGCRLPMDDDGVCRCARLPPSRRSSAILNPEWMQLLSFVLRSLPLVVPCAADGCTHTPSCLSVFGWHCDRRTELCPLCPHSHLSDKLFPDTPPLLLSQMPTNFTKRLREGIDHVCLPIMISFLVCQHFSDHEHKSVVVFREAI